MPTRRKRIKRKVLQEWHMRTRAYMRYGVILEDAEYRKLVDDVQHGRAEFLCRESRRVTKWRVRLSNGERAIAVYDEKRKRVMTLLYDVSDC